MSTSSTDSTRRGRDIHEQHRVATPLELLFDLTFVVALSLAASQLHHGLAEHHLGNALAQFAVSFFGIWWAWMNFTWFASAYDNDDLAFRLLTMAQMVGVLVFATGQAGLAQGDFRVVVMGYAIMRVALVVQWLRAARGDPARRNTCLRYAAGIGVLQLLWIARLACPPQWATAALLVLIACELLVPVWAERAGPTPWHAHHIAERYGLFVIIALGECVLGGANAVSNVWRAQGGSFSLGLVGVGSMLLVLCLWWIYYLLPSGEALHQHRERAFTWGYAHFFVFGAIAMMGAGLEVIADTLAPGAVTPGDTAQPGFAVLTVALPMAVFIVSVTALHGYVARIRARQRGIMLVCLACIALATLAVLQGLPLPWGLVLLSGGPIYAIARYEHGRKHRAAHFTIQ